MGVIVDDMANSWKILSKASSTYMDSIKDVMQKRKQRFKERLRYQNLDRVVLPKGSTFRVS